MKNVLAFLIYTAFILLIGRSLLFLPHFTLFASPTRQADALTRSIKNIIAKQPGNYAVYFVNLETGQNVSLNSHEIFTAASVNKLPIIFTLYHLAAEKKINLNEQVTIQTSDMQDYGTGSIRYQKPGVVYSLKTLAKLTLQESDNTAAHVLADRIGIDEIQSYINGLGLKQTSMVNNETSLADMYLLLKTFYDRKITTPALTLEVLDFMTNTDTEDRIPADLPKSVIVYHKTGDAVGDVHDVDIIKDGTDAYFLGIMTSDIGDHQAETKATMAKIALTLVNSYHQ